MSASLDLKSKEEKDAELDKRIEALRRKNQALIKRYQEIEEDRKKAEQEGIAVTGGRRPRAAEGDAIVLERRRGELDSPTLTVQVLLSQEEKHVVSNERKHPASAKPPRSSPHGQGSLRGVFYSGSRSPRGEYPPEQPEWEEGSTAGPGAGKRGGGRGGGRGRRPCGGHGGPGGDAGPDRRSKEWEERRKQNIEKMNEEMEKIAEYERSQRDGAQEKNPVRNFLDDPRRSGSFAETDRREGSRRHIRNWGGPDFDKVKTGIEQGKEWPSPGRGGSRRRGGPPPAASLDMTLCMTGRERAEYIRWKQEREQIDQERLARHRQPTGEWRREWDAEKMDAAFKEGSKPGSSGGSGGGKHGESKRPPKLPTFGEFLSEQQPDRRRRGRGRGRGRPRGSGPSKPYSMHDNRWEKEEPDQATPPAQVEEKSAVDTVQQVEKPASPQVVLEEEMVEGEEEDQWEDVSGGEEEEEEEEVEAGSNNSQGSDAEEEEEGKEEQQPSPLPPSTSSSQPPGKNGQLSLAMPPPPEEEEAPNTDGKPLTPFSPAEGYHPVSDWGEEMELNSPRANLTKSPLAASEVGPSASSGPASTYSPSGSGSQQSTVEVSEKEAPPVPGAPVAEMSKEPEVDNLNKQSVQGEPDNQDDNGAAAGTLATVPVEGEITDIQKE
ncbi:coiled-coil domain-containing protein 9 isoform X2 [Anolis carolinensis]|uniref:coiled-coil domain-containing protein 9 isoform X2 n=1 Tax=Anolis carolinensis TaxID=28377 RepID=UPI000462E3BD|nr:PREDICTED: coiled-coil domain-containing protein 9 isoform X2 [Anolis carolinensis]|eukprot:XP_008112006.1 PREDICTED: coiled-coil domain-containing protein 9 isoform X2 [Anolis carolinensis]